MYADFSNFFSRIAEFDIDPHRWQSELAEDAVCRDRLIRIPTGFGKTLGVLATWLWHRVERCNETWPRRLIWCLPMRVLVEQTEAEVRRVLLRISRFWDGTAAHAGKVAVHLLMGGTDSGEWYLHPEHYAVLIGTQDMLLSRALNRGYGSPRARWPMEFGLLHEDALWVMDEVQLMDVGLATSAQLQQFRREHREQALRPAHTWWMSATLQPDWLARSPDTATMAAELDDSATRIRAEHRTGPLWTEVAKPRALETLKDEKSLAKRIADEHRSGEAGPTLVVVNRVERAVKLAIELRANRYLKSDGTDIRLTHSRFRAGDRATWRDDFLHRGACVKGTNRIIVSTQVVEAGVDISSGVLFTDLAPWASLVQRFGRCARWGGTAQVHIIDSGTMTDAAAAPYAADELNAALEALRMIEDVGPRHLEEFEEQHPELLPTLYPYAPKHLLLRHELDELFDTTPDLSGAHVDISRFIRSGNERDVQVFWDDVPRDGPEKSRRPLREELCAVPFLRARDWLCGVKSGNSEPRRLKKGMRAWVWDWTEGRWRKAERRDLYPGATVLVDSKCGGYSRDEGWMPERSDPVKPPGLVNPTASTKVPVECWAPGPDGGIRVAQRLRNSRDPTEYADASEEDESLSLAVSWQTIAFHGQQTGKEAAALARLLAPDLASLMDLAGRWHDVGKVHLAFGSSIRHVDRPLRHDLAKAPDAAWPCRAEYLYRVSRAERRAGFRHELAGTLALFAVLQRHAPNHGALCGPFGLLLDKLGRTAAPGDVCEPNALEREILALDAARFNLVAWMVCTHHGKVRLAWHASPADQKGRLDKLRIRGVQEGDALPSLVLATSDGDYVELPESRLDLAPAAAGLSPRTGPSWTERVLGLLETHGPFTLAYLEALIRTADIRASRTPGLADPLLSQHNLAHGLENRRSGMAQAARRAATGAAAGPRPDTDLAEHGLRAGAGEPGMAPGLTRRPHEATRNFDTAQGRLSYAQLAQRLAEPLLRLEERIRSGEFADHALDPDLLLQFHREVCSGLFPDAAGQYRKQAVQVGTHEPPPPEQVAHRILDYIRNLETRLQHLPAEPNERWLETLAYAEGELLSIHPFPDLNGRISRLWLSELLRRMGLPPVDIIPSDESFRERYLAALRSADRHDLQSLMTLWRERLERPGDQP